MNVFIIIFAVILFNLIIFIHEFGHFFTAKLFGVRVNEFAIGMGPRIFKAKRGDTLYSIRLFPIGGFCAMEGEDEESPEEYSFNKKEPWKRMIIISSGAIMNILLGILMTFILLCQQTKFLSTHISKFTDNSVSNHSGLEVGDEVISVDGYRTYSHKDLMFSLTVDGKEDFDVDVNRGGEKITLNNVKFNVLPGKNNSKSTQVDFYVDTIDKTPWTLMRYTFIDTVSTVRIVWSSLAGIVSGRFSLSNMSGPVGIASAIGKATDEGLKVNVMFAINSIISMMAMITINLGVFNLLPLPALDGGRLVFIAFEMILGTSLSTKYEGWIHALGFVLFIALMLFITYSDIVKLVKG